MTTQAELKAKFWEAIGKDRTAMLGCTGVYPRPMTAQAEDDRGPIWFFTARANDLAEATARKPQQGLLLFAAKGHDLFATVGGTLQQDNDPRVIDRLWNPFVAAWYTGKDDPSLRLLRFDPGVAEIWQNASSLLSGIKMLVGIDPKRDYQDDVAKVRLGKG
ncbi:MAG TPA: pyridoxamine 5'-phosphate oxidase family protein [Thermomonas sp.]|nr:pyridoxamine 5'-phosphate oxidase family protein [Thermomonas sp.]